MPSRFTRLAAAFAAASACLTAPAWAAHGIAPAVMNTKADACTDFFDYANGNWRAENPIPSYMNTPRSHALLFALALFASPLAAVAAQNALIPDTPPSGVVSDTEFLRRANAATRGEVQMSQVAAAQAVDAEVRAQAGRLGADYGRNSDQLGALAKSKSVELPTALESGYQSAVDDLKNLKGQDFDLAYMKAVRTDHEMLVGLFEGAAAHANDADIRQYAADTLPVLQAHLAKAQQLEIKRR